MRSVLLAVTATVAIGCSATTNDARPESVGARRDALARCFPVYTQADPGECNGQRRQMPTPDQFGTLGTAGVRVRLPPVPSRRPAPPAEISPSLPCETRAEELCAMRHRNDDGSIDALPGMEDRKVIGVVTLATLAADGSITPDEMRSRTSEALGYYQQCGLDLSAIQILNEPDGDIETVPESSLAPLFVAGATEAHRLYPDAAVITPGFTGHHCGAAGGCDPAHADPIGAIGDFVGRPGVLGAADLVGDHAYCPGCDDPEAALSAGLDAIQDAIDAAGGAQGIAITETNEAFSPGAPCSQGELLQAQFRAVARHPRVALVSIYTNDKGPEECASDPAPGACITGMHLFEDDGSMRSGAWAVANVGHCDPAHPTSDSVGCLPPSPDPPTPPGTCHGCRDGGTLYCGHVPDGCGGEIDCGSSCPGTMTCGAPGADHQCVSDCYGTCYASAHDDRELTCCHWGCMCSGDPGGLAWPCGLVHYFDHCDW